ncbi:MAG: hypothetical protein R3B82_27535 [Sandaracinaceae bacterium]
MAGPKKIEAAECPTVIITEEGQRFGVQLVPALPEDVPVLVQIREDLVADMSLVMHGLRGIAFMEWMPTNRDDFERKHPADPPNPNRLRPRVLSGYSVISSPLEEVERQKAEHEARMKAAQERLDAAEREKAEAARRAKLEPLERQAEDLQAQLDAERAERERLEAQLKAAGVDPADLAKAGAELLRQIDLPPADPEAVEVDVDVEEAESTSADETPPEAASAAEETPQAPADGEDLAMQDLDCSGAQGEASEAEATTDEQPEADSAPSRVGRRRGARQR